MPRIELRFRSVVLRLGRPARDKPCAVLSHRAPERQFCPATVVPAVMLSWELRGVRQRRRCCATRLADFAPIRSCASPARRTAVVWTASLAAVSAHFGAGVASRAPSKPVQGGRLGSVPAAPTPGSASSWRGYGPHWCRSRGIQIGCVRRIHGNAVALVSVDASVQPCVADQRSMSEGQSAKYDIDFEDFGGPIDSCQQAGKDAPVCLHCPVV